MDSLSVIQRLGTHRFIEELADAIAQVGNGVAQTRRKGKVTVTFTVSPAPGNELGVTVEEVIKPTPPVKDARGAYFFALDGELHDSDPRQPQMEFRTVDKTTGEVIVVDANSTVVSIERSAS